MGQRGERLIGILSCLRCDPFQRDVTDIGLGVLCGSVWNGW
jgi:hypothetical protein